MRALFLLLTTFGSPPVTSHPVETPPSAQSPLSLLLASVRPADGGLYIFGGSTISREPAGDQGGIGWKSADGSTVEVASNGATYRRPIWETDVYRLFVSAGTDLGIRQEYYLGHHFVAQFDVGLGTSSLDVVWYLTEYDTLSFSLDPLRGRLGWRWNTIPERLMEADSSNDWKGIYEFLSKLPHSARNLYEYHHSG